MPTFQILVERAPDTCRYSRHPRRYRAIALRYVGEVMSVDEIGEASSVHDAVNIVRDVCRSTHGRAIVRRTSAWRRD
jgi:hypothetical protein